MAARNSPSQGGKPDKLMRDAIMVALKREAKDADGQPTKKLALIANKLVDLAIEGDMQAIKEVCDRSDGKAIQMIGGDEESPIRFMIEGVKDALKAKLDRVANPAADQSPDVGTE